MTHNKPTPKIRFSLADFDLDAARAERDRIVDASNDDAAPWWDVVYRFGDAHVEWHRARLTENVHEWSDNTFLPLNDRSVAVDLAMLLGLIPGGAA